MISKKVEALKKFHNVSLANGVLKFIITASSCFNIDSSNPDKTLDLCDRAMVVAKLAGSDKVTKQHVKQVFLNSIELFNGMAKEDVLQIAYHEAAHYVVAKMTSSIKKDDVIAISILPTSTYLGVNVTEKNDFFVNFDSKYCLDEIATLLAGKAIEEMRFGIVTTGPTNDLEQATSIAKNYISVFGMDKDIGIASYGAESNILDSSNECINMINSKINQILAEQYKRAKEILADNSEFLNVVANALVKNCILVKSDLDKIYQNCNCANVASC